MATNRVTFLVDGFKVYHSLKHARNAADTAELRWLDLRSLFCSYLHLFGRDCGNTAEHHEEKETDVSIAAKMFELLVRHAFFSEKGSLWQGRRGGRDG